MHQVARGRKHDGAVVSRDGGVEAGGRGVDLERELGRVGEPASRYQYLRDMPAGMLRISQEICRQVSISQRYASRYAQNISEICRQVSISQRYASRYQYLRDMPAGINI
eukprot:SAG31_NODE_54_length_29987_cov_4.570664_7_plen_109_part_00